MLAPAKINLMLHVTGKRADGYHLLQSLVCFAALGDEISLNPANDFSLKVTGEFADNLEGGNLVTKAAHALAEAHIITPRGAIALDKKLPVGSGLGGGSADAAAALKLLSGVWKCSIPDGLPERLGSDLPACLKNTPCWMEGTGERITPVSIAFDTPVLLVNPRIPLATKTVYQRLEPPYTASITLPAHFATHGTLLEFLHATRNALEIPATLMEPAIHTLLSAIASLPRCQLARMSGSGATCFGLFPSQEACEAAKNTLEAAHPQWWIRSTMLKGSHGKAQ